MDKTAFTDYLLSIGFNEIGAAEVIQRLVEGEPDMEDFNLYKRYWTAAANRV